MQCFDFSFSRSMLKLRAMLVYDFLLNKKKDER